MEELLKNLSFLSSTKMQEIGFITFLLLMLISFLSSYFISFLYSIFYTPRSTGSQVHKAFPLVGLSITAIFISIQFSLPLSLGLLGALSIVRFRTPIKEPEEIGFIMLVVAVSLCCATFNLSFLVITLLVGIIAMLTVQFTKVFLKGKKNDGMLIISMPPADYYEKTKQFIKLLEQKIPRGRIESVTDNQTETVISYSFVGLDQLSMIEFQEDLKKTVSSATSNVFFNRQGEI